MMPVRLLTAMDWEKFAQVRKYVYQASSRKRNIRALPLEPTRKIHHFAHPGHPLTLVRIANDGGRTCLCFACGNCLCQLVFYCEQCDFILDVECATPVKEVNGKVEHFSHEHPLKLWDKEEEEEEDEVFCSLCGKCCSAGLTYSCAQCKTFLHRFCAELPSKILHPYHWYHPLYLLLPEARNSVVTDLVCDACHRKCCGNGITFRCDPCNFNLHLDCIRGTIEFEGHDHLLAFIEKINDSNHHQCNACKTSVTSESSAFYCIECDVYFHLLCGPLPCTIEHQSDLHPLTLMDYLVEDDSGEYYCEACEERRDPRDCVYHCADCKFIVHFDCVISEVILSLKGERGNVVLRTLDGRVPGQVIGKGILMKEIERKDAEASWKTPVSLTLGNINFTTDEEMTLHGIWAVMDRESKEDRKTVSSDPGQHKDSNGSLVFSPYSNEVFAKFMDRLEYSSIPNFDSLITYEDKMSEIVVVGSHMVTQSLVPAFKKLLAKCGDISAGSVVSPRVKMFLFVVICRAIHDMCTIRVVDIEFDVLCRWWNCFRFVQIAGFKTQAQFDHLKRVAQAYHGLETRKTVDDSVAKFDKKIIEVSGKIAELTSKLEAMREKYNQNSESRKSSFMEKCLSEASASKWKTAGTGLV